MDRQAWIAVSLCVIGLIALLIYNSKHLPPPARATASPTPAGTPSAVASESPAASRAPENIATAAPTASTPAFEDKFETLQNDDVELRLTNRGGGISEAILLKHSVKGGQRVVLNSPDHPPIGAIVDQPNAPDLPEFKLLRDPDGAMALDRVTPEGLSIHKKIFFPPTADKKDNFVAEMDVDFRNDGAQPYVNQGYFVSLGSTQPLHPNDFPTYTRLVWCIDGKANSKDTTWFAAQRYPIVGVQSRAEQAIFQQKVNGAEWAAMSNQFFTTILTPLHAKAVEVWGEPFNVETPAGPPVRGMVGAMGMPGFQLAPGQTTTLRFQLYLGPKLYARLTKLEHDEAEIMNFGLWKFVSQFLLNFMNLIHGWVHDYGFSIIILTACVKGVLWPLQNKANRSMRKMSALAPKMQELKDKYKDDPTRMNQELMKVYKEHGVNPVGGCFPMMIQIPIFFGLFSMLREAAELRNATFLWVKDLSQPDTLFVIPALGFVPVIGGPAGLPINVLPLIMGATNIWLMRMTPKTGDATQQRVMMFMPLIFLIFCYNFAAALALYYTTQNLFTILQLYQNRKQPVPVLEKVAPAGKKSRKGRP